ncbi:Protein of uncharacterised function (DUF421) [Legionella beliardensis]|uniref:Protein of uncharacterized function (DUF421) n=1 Tax=Legionella beliardensis TaxID=91822 RepID=A0A378HZJ2_9GAMM|nr:YetF domain-containing protein [Legionella beliardensis]STX28349.1 Protein of uncharacterised function (DUF421) [Legionella beliardensis]
MGELNEIIGFDKLLAYDLYIRSLVITLYALFLFRATSARLFGEHSTFDFIISIILGAILGEAIVNNIPLLPSMIACAIIVIVHRILAFLSYKSHYVGKYIKGEKIVIIKDGQYQWDKLHCCRITENDILQSLRAQHSTDDMSNVDRAILERNGEISFLFKEAKRSSV